MSLLVNIESSAVDAFRDVQTSITSLGGAIAGYSAEQLSNYVIHKSRLNQSEGLGQIGLRFAVRSLIASTAFGIAARYMPKTSENIFFSIVFFAANPSMVKDAVTIGKHAVLAVEELWGGSVGGMRYGPGPVISSGPQYGTGPVISSGPGCKKGYCN